MRQAQIGPVHETVREIESWSDIMRKNSTQSNTLSLKSVEQAVRSVTAEDERAENFIIFGLNSRGRKRLQIRGYHLRDGQSFLRIAEI